MYNDRYLSTSLKEKNSVAKKNKTENVQIRPYVNVDSVDVARLLMADPQVQVRSVGVAWTSQHVSKKSREYLMYINMYAYCLNAIG